MNTKNKPRFSNNTQGTFFVVATPIGNLEDITLRALRILKEVNIVICEDTRVTKKLLAHFDIHTPTASFHANSNERDFEKIKESLSEGKNMAYVCDAGTPGVSDPGLELISNIRAAGFPIETIPGASALTAALSISGLRAASFTFYGFLPHKKGRETLFKEIAANERASVFYESPHRILKALESLSKTLQRERRVGVFRELTKLYEEAIIGHASEVLERVQSDPNKQKGEFVVIVEGK